MSPDTLQSPSLPERLSARELLAADLPKREMILDPIIAEKTLAMLYGPRGLGKTFVALGIAWAAASGKRFLKWRATRPRRVLYIDGEMAAVDMKERLRRMGPAPDKLGFVIADLSRNALPDLADIHGQRALIQSWGPMPELLVLDNLSSLVGFRRNDPDSWNGVQRWLMAMRRHGIAVLVVHHANKGGAQRGTSRREDVLDVVLSLRRPSDYQPQDGARFELHFEKARGLFGNAVEPIEARMTMDETESVKWHWKPARVDELDRFVDLLKEGKTTQQAAELMKISRAKGYRLRKQAMTRGVASPEP